MALAHEHAAHADRTARVGRGPGRVLGRGATDGVSALVVTMDGGFYFRLASASPTLQYNVNFYTRSDSDLNTRPL